MLIMVESVIIFSLIGHHVRHTEVERCAKRHSGDSNLPRAHVTRNATRTGTHSVSISRSVTHFSVDDSKSFQETSIPRIVYQILNDKKFTFRNYLSILSVYKVLRPYRIILYVPEDFRPRPLEYNMWFQKAMDTIPYLEVNTYTGEFGISGGIGELRFLSSVLGERGGVYVNLNTIILRDLWKKGDKDIQVGIIDVADVSFVGFIAVNRNILTNFTKITKIGDLKKENITTDCVLHRDFSGSEQCCLTPDKLHPIKVVREKTPFAEVTRFLYYGTTKILEPKRSFPPIPKIVHYTWFGGGAMTYAMYLSFKSTLKFVNPKKVFIYVDSYNLGPYFEAMKNSSLVTVVYYGTPRTIFQRPLKKPSHVSDYVRTDALLRHGGIYLDWDAFWLKPADDLLTLGYETIATFDHFMKVGSRRDFPDVINMGVVLARPGSRFIALWQDSFHKYIGNPDTFHAVEMVYKIYEDHPDLLYIEKRLQVMCFMLKCHPIWLPNYQDDRTHNVFNFTKDTYAVHFTYPLPREFISEEGMRQGEGFFADMARHIHGP